MLEILVTMVIMGIAVSMAVANLTTSSARTLDAQARWVALALEAARDEAMFTGRPTAWAIREGAVTFLGLDPGGLARIKPEGGVQITEFTIDSKKAKPDAVYTFLPHGLGPKFALHLAVDGKTSIISGGPLGNIKVEAGQ